MRVGWTVQNTLKVGGTENRGRETKILKRRGKLGQGVGTLKRGKVGTPSQTLSEVSSKKGVLENFTKFIGKHLCWSFSRVCFY